MAGLHFLVCLGMAPATDTWGLLLWVGVPAVLVPWLKRAAINEHSKAR